MKTYLDCIPCFIRQALDAARMVTQDEAVCQQVLRRVLELSDMVRVIDSGVDAPGTPLALVIDGRNLKEPC